MKCPLSAVMDVRLPYLLWLLLNNNINIRVWAGPGPTGVLYWPFFYFCSQSTSLLRPVFSDDLGRKTMVKLLLLWPPNPGVLP